jgi:hypothetical protein
MKTEYREHPLGTPGLTARFEREPSGPPRPPMLVWRVERLLTLLRRWARVS